VELQLKITTIGPQSSWWQGYFPKLAKCLVLELLSLLVSPPFFYLQECFFYGQALEWVVPLMSR
jgi:hypothetical protein